MLELLWHYCWDFHFNSVVCVYVFMYVLCACVCLCVCSLSVAVANLRMVSPCLASLLSRNVRIHNTLIPNASNTAGISQSEIVSRVAHSDLGVGRVLA